MATEALTLIGMKLVDSEKFVKLNFKEFDSYKKAIDYIKIISSKTIDFLEGIVYNSRKIVIITGEKINRANTDILLVAFGAPKQDKFIYQNRSRRQGIFRIKNF